MPFFRSEPMSLCHLVMHQECAFDTLVELGYVGKVQFVQALDEHEEPNNKFQHEVKRCEDLLKKIKFLQDQINSFGMHTVYYDDADEERPKEKDLSEVETTVQTLYTELTDVETHSDAVHKKRYILYEHRQVLEKVEQFLTGAQNTEPQIAGTDSFMQHLIKDSGGERDGVGLIIVCGSIPVARFAAFELLVWRLGHGNVFVKHSVFEFSDELAKLVQFQNKYAFMLAFVGEVLHSKILKVCQGFEIRLYACGNTSAKRRHMLQELVTEFQYLQQALEQSNELKTRVLSVARGDLFIWRAKIKKMLQVYHLINHFGIVRDARREYVKYLKTDCWIPRADVKEVRAALARASSEAGTRVFSPILVERNYYLHGFVQPTYFRTNKFTRGFQNLIDAYGIATYRELNPAPYTIITFPFLFAVMFGDVGHGILMSLFAIALIWREKKIDREQKQSISSSEIFDMLFAGRYIMLLMGLFSIYTGFIYNDFLSKSMNIFGSQWRANVATSDMNHLKNIQLDPTNRTHYLGTPYIFGLDPVWKGLTHNEIILNNSLKMKLAIILGVVHMLFGLCLSGWNAWFFRSKSDFILVFLPQIVFFMSLFFYLVVLIFHKWSWYGGYEKGGKSVGCAPSLLITFINMVLIKYEKAPEGCDPTMFAGQTELERTLLFIALCAVPILLCGKPLYIVYESRRLNNTTDPEEYEERRLGTLSTIRRSLIYSIDARKLTLQAVSTNDMEETLSEVCIHQAIHTIECVLGSVSHTASYLRLWALSLAHTQLSEVLWTMVLSQGLHSKFGYYNCILIVFTFAAFASLTVGILVVMEGLSAFLHTLRLHWVEFQSKFYSGLGAPFTPFHFQASQKRDSYA